MKSFISITKINRNINALSFKSSQLKAVRHLKLSMIGGIKDLTQDVNPIKVNLL